MTAVTLKEAKLNLEDLLERVLADAEPTIVVTETGEQVVVLPLAEYSAWKETLYLLANPANAEHLRQSIAEARDGDRADDHLLQIPLLEIAHAGVPRPDERARDK